MEIEISDHNILIFLFLKTAFTKMLQNKLQYRNYKQSEVHRFLQVVEQLPEKISPTELEKEFVETLSKHASLKTKVIREYHKSFITKILRKAIMKLSTLKKKGNISNNPQRIKLCKRNKEIMFLISVEKLRQNISKSIYHEVHLLKIFGHFVNHSLQIKQETLTTKSCWCELKK